MFFFRQGDYFVGFSTTGDLIISNVAGRFIRIGIANDAVAPYKNKANAGLLNKWRSLSIHWYKSSVYCNGVKLTNLQINDEMEIGALNFNSKHRFCNFAMNLAGTGMFKGDIALIVFRKGIMEEKTIVMHHKLFCEKWYNIDHNPIE